MRIRTIKPAFWKSLPIAELAIRTRLHFIGLLNYADDDGRGVDDARLIKGELWSLDQKITVNTVEQMQQELAAGGRIQRYEVSGRRYFQIVNWSEHQKVDHPVKSLIPPVEDPEASLFDARDFAEGSRGPRAVLDSSSKGRYRKGRDRKGLAPADAAAGALANPSRATPEGDPIFEVLFALETGLSYSAENRNVLTKAAAGTLNQAASQVRATGITPEGLSAAIGAWPSVFDDATCTASAVAKHLPRLVAGSNGAIARRSEPSMAADLDRAADAVRARAR